MCLFVFGAVGAVFVGYQSILITVPATGGSLTEGVIGTPRFINPLLAISDADRDLTALVYSGLLRPTPDGSLVPDLAEGYTVSDDDLTYTFTLKNNLRWHDGAPVTADDVVFTVTKVQDSSLKSPKRASWEGVAAEKIDERTVQFKLKQPYTPFLENATLGIIPKHLWNAVSSEQFGFSKFNIEPVGTGPYRIERIRYGASGIPQFYDLKPFRAFALGAPYVNSVRIKFYGSEEALLAALNSGDVEAVNAIAPQQARAFETAGYRIITYLLPRVFGVFFNQNQNPIFTSEAIRVALATAVDREAIVQTNLFGYGTPLEGPLPPGALGYVPRDRGDAEEPTDAAPDHLKEAGEILLRNGWVADEETGMRTRTVKKKTETLAFSLVTSDASELKQVGAALAETWRSLGADVTFNAFGTNDLNQNVIRPRKYDALLFGEIIGRESDPFAFWHSSQRNDPGLNIALYANISADKLLERGRITRDAEKRRDIYIQFDAAVRKDTPAVFIYSPDFIYIVPEKIKGITAGTITVPSERFIDIFKWHIETNKVLPFFAR